MTPPKKDEMRDEDERPRISHRICRAKFVQLHRVAGVPACHLGEPLFPKLQGGSSPKPMAVRAESRWRGAGEARTGSRA